MKLCLAAALLSLLALVGSASAELAANAGVDHVKWNESGEDDGGNIIGAGLSYTEDGATGRLLAYRGRLIVGGTDYEGLDAIGGMASGTSKNYLLGNEIQMRSRSAYEKEHVMDVVLGLGWEHWMRKIPGTLEKRTYDTAYFRLGIEFDTEARKEGWIGGVGMKYPLISKVKRDLSNQGLGSFTLKPGGDFSAYAQLGYRIDSAWSVFWYFDTFRYRASDAVDAPNTLNGTLIQEKFNVTFSGIRVQRNF